MKVADLFGVAVAGLRQQLDAMNGAATQVLLASTQPSTPDRVSVSADARQAAASEGSAQPDLAGAMVDLRVSKYLAVANMKVVQTGEEMAKDLTDLLGSG